MDNSNGLVYVVDDDVSVREGLASFLSAAGLKAQTASSGEEFLAMPRAEIPSCLVLDVNLPGLSGIALQEELIRCGIQIPIIFLTGHGDIPMTVRALKSGAVEFFTKPTNNQELLNAVRQYVALPRAATGLSKVSSDSIDEELQSEQEIRSHIGFEKIIGRSAAIEHVLEMVETVAPSDSTVLLLGETGTGKELIARAIHDHSRRKDGHFVKLNCAAIPTGLLESELFGHEKGAFTGAIAQKVGRLELADQGTLFLDEVGDIPIEIQPKLLRALQEREFERLGSAHTRKVNVRLVAATNRDLEEMVADREFRSDLYYRLNVFPIRIPPLRERREDIPLLANYFVQKFTKQMQKKVKGIPPCVMEGLVAWDWPGNIRELENFVERAVILTCGTSLEAPLSELRKVRDAKAIATLPQAGCEDIAEIVKKTLSSLAGGDQLLYPNANKQRDDIVRALTESKGRVGGPDGAAARLGVNRTTLIARLKKFGIAPRNFV
jgi:DNA-binding NtrC family response regulator